MQKLYCYVDESGQDTSANPDREQIFVVAVTVFEENRLALEALCEKYELSSGKDKRKWNKTRPAQQLAYIRSIFQDAQFAGTLCYSATQHLAKPNFERLTISAIASAIHIKYPSGDYQAEIYIDGLSKSKQNSYSSGVRKSGVNVRRVHRIRDESSAFIRLADALAGLARQAIEGKNTEALALMKYGLRHGIVIEV